MYVFGGEDAQGNTNDFYTFDFSTMEWSWLTTVQGTAPSPRSFQSSTLIPPNDYFSEPKIALFGGYTEDGFSNDLYFYNIF